MAYLAFRGIQNDQALLEKEERGQLRGTAQEVTGSVHKDILEVERTFLSSIARSNGLSRRSLIRLIDSLKRRQPLVEEVFYFRKSVGIRLPASELLFLPDDSTNPVPSSLRGKSLVENIGAARKLEFQRKEFGKALERYEEAITLCADRNAKGRVLNAIARVEKKAGLYGDAIKSCRLVDREYGHVRIKGKLPIGITAELELASLYLSVDDSTSAIKTSMRLYGALISGKWILRKSQYDFCARQVRESIDGLLAASSSTLVADSARTHFRNLREKERIRRNRTERLLAFQEYAVKDVQERIVQDGLKSGEASKRFTLEMGGHRYLVSVSLRCSRKDRRLNRNWGLLLNEEYLKDRLLKQILQQDVTSEGTGWLVRGKDGRSILKAGVISARFVTVKASFDGNFPPWFIDFYHQAPGIFDTPPAAHKDIYFYMFLLIVGILVFGVIFSIRSVDHELEIAGMKSDFVSTVSHEFKAPLTSMRQLAEMLRDKRVPSEERRQQYYDVMVEQSRRLSLLIDNVLNLSRMEEGRNQFGSEEIDANALVEEAASIAQDRVRHEGFVVQKEIGSSPTLVRGDRIAIGEALDNLIDNAIKYSGKAKKITVRVFTDNRHVAISVEDYGIGIQKEEIGKIFERFYRGDSESRQSVRGSGIGLTLVKQIVEAHHGTIHVESEPWIGSTFTMRFPLVTAESGRKVYD